MAGGNENGILVNDRSNRLNSLKDFPMLYPDAGVVDPRYYGYEMMELTKPPFWDGKTMNLPPNFTWGGRIGAAPPNQRYPGWLNINRTQDVAISLTKIASRHTFKGGFYLNHSYKAQNVGGTLFQGNVNFGNDTNNALDTGFGYANAALGVFTRTAGGEVRRRQHALQPHRVLPAGQLEGDQPPDAGLRDALRESTAAVRPVPADVELLPR